MPTDRNYSVIEMYFVYEFIIVISMSNSQLIVFDSVLKYFKILEIL